MFRFEKLEIWSYANDYAKAIYLVTKSFPHDELYALTDQLKRSATSIAANIAEGSGSSSDKDFSHYLDIAIKSTYETVSHLYFASSQMYITEEKRTELYLQAEVLVKKMQAFRQWLNNKK